MTHLARTAAATLLALGALTLAAGPGSAAGGTTTGGNWGWDATGSHTTGSNWGWD